MSVLFVIQSVPSRKQFDNLPGFEGAGTKEKS